MSTFLSSLSSLLGPLLSPHPGSPVATEEPLHPYIFTMLLPTVTFWLAAGGLHWMGANEGYSGKVKGECWSVHVELGVNDSHSRDRAQSRPC